MFRAYILGLILSSALATTSAAADEVTLKGSPASMVRQNQVAKENDYTFLRDPAQVRDFVEEGRLVRIEGNDDYRVVGVGYPYARPELRAFLERLSLQYRSGCGEQLVVTSLTRPLSTQPVNAHPLSVHPAGMAADLRVSADEECRSWLEGTLLSLEQKGLLDVTRERQPPHYHVAVFPGPYMAHVARQDAAASERAAAPERPVEAAAGPVGASGAAVDNAAVRRRADGAGKKSGLERFLLALALSLALIFSLSRGQRIGWTRGF